MSRDAEECWENEAALCCVNSNTNIGAAWHIHTILLKDHRFVEEVATV